MRELAKLVKQVEDIILDLVEDELRDNEAIENSDDLIDALEYNGRIFETVDGCIPILNSELIDLAIEDNRLLTTIPEFVHGEPLIEMLEPIRLLQLNVFEMLEAAAYQYLRSHEIEQLIFDRLLTVEIRRDSDEPMTGIYWETIEDRYEVTSKSFWAAFNAACVMAEDYGKTSLIIEWGESLNTYPKVDGSMLLWWGIS